MPDTVERVQAEIAANETWRDDVRERYAAFVEADIAAITDVVYSLRLAALPVPATLKAIIREYGTTAAYIRTGGPFGEDIAELRMRLRKEL